MIDLHKEYFVNMSGGEAKKVSKPNSVKTVLFLITISIALLFFIKIPPIFAQDKVTFYEGGIFFSYARNQEFIDFLKEHDGQKIQIDTSIHADISIWENSVVLEKCEADNPGTFEQLYDLNFSNMNIPLAILEEGATGLTEPKDVNCNLNYLNLQEQDITYTTTHGGTGVVQIPFKGIFEVEVIKEDTSPHYFQLKRLSD
ncbi:hypothetical protein [Curvivirga sp.]|uniref:hypothetical protein n=1 Tax=Curvivirga sp. TaxID=2856848 RepID=UPI003B5C1C70